MGSNKLDQGVSDRALGIALAISLHVSEVTDMAGLVRRSTVGLVVRVNCCRISLECVHKSNAKVRVLVSRGTLEPPSLVHSSEG